MIKTRLEAAENLLSPNHLRYICLIAFIFLAFLLMPMLKLVSNNEKFLVINADTCKFSIDFFYIKLSSVDVGSQ